MRVVQLKRGRIVKFATAGLIALALLVLLAQKSGFKLRSESSGGNNAGLAARLQDLQHQQQVLHHHQGRSYPEDVPRFLGTSTSGNFEPPLNQKVSKLIYIQKYVPKMFDLSFTCFFCYRNFNR